MASATDFRSQPFSLALVQSEGSVVIHLAYPGTRVSAGEEMPQPASS